MTVHETPIPGLLVIEPKAVGDERGFFMEAFREEAYAAAGIKVRFVQDNVSYSRRGVLRGLHLQFPRPQGKLVSVLRGEVYDVAVDLRDGSPNFGQWHGVVLSAENRLQFYLPPGMAHGFLVTGDEALFTYKCSDYYHPQGDFSVRWDDPDIGVEWPLAGLEPQLSAKDLGALRLADVPRGRLVPYTAGP